MQNNPHARIQEDTYTSGIRRIAENSQLASQRSSPRAAASKSLTSK